MFLRCLATEFADTGQLMTEEGPPAGMLAGFVSPQAPLTALQRRMRTSAARQMRAQMTALRISPARGINHRLAASDPTHPPAKSAL